METETETDIVEEVNDKPKPKTVEELQIELFQFYGTFQYYQHGLVQPFRWTDGIQFVCCRVGAFWLMDVIASYFRKFIQLAQPEKTNNLFWICRLIVREDNTCTVDFREDTNKEPVISQEIPYTDFPKGTFEFYVILEGNLEAMTALLKSEY